MRYPMRLDVAWRPLLALFGGTSRSAFAEIRDGGLRFRFGWAFDETVPLGDVEDVGPTTWPLWAGIGWRITTRGRIGLIGSRRGVVDVRFRSARRVRLVVIPWQCRGVAVSLIDGEGFIADLRRAPAPTRE
jgi:hypothetical protein